MARSEFGSMHCNVARAVDVLTEWWTPLILRDLLIGIRQFGQLQRDLGISTNVLTARLSRLIDHGLVAREPYGAHPHRYEYRLTDKGKSAVPILLALLAWGDEWECDPAGPPTQIVHTTCGRVTTAVSHCVECGEVLDPADIEYRKGPGSRQAPGTELLPSFLGEA